MALTTRAVKGTALTHAEMDANFNGLANGSLITPSTAALKLALAQQLGVPYVLAQSAVAVSGAADTAENTLATITVPANAMGPNGTLRIWTSWAHTNGADDKILRVRFSGASGTQYAAITATTTAGFRGLVEISNRGATNSQYGSPNGTGLGTTSQPPITSAVDTTAATTIVITGQKETGTDTLTLERYLVEVLYGA